MTLKDSQKSNDPAAPSKASPPDKPIEGLTQQEAARLAGCAQSTVSRAIARGDIHTLSNGRLPQNAVDRLRHLRKADQDSDDAVDDLKRRLLAAETAEREAKAKLKILELERAAGKYVELALVQRDGADTGERVLAVLRAIPQRTAMKLECGCRRAAVVERTISDEVERAIAELHQSLFIRAGGA